MIIVSVKASAEKPGADSGLRQIEFSDGTLITLKINYLSQPEVCEAEGVEISPADKDQLLFAADCLKAERAALRLIARAEQNTFMLAGKLEKRGHEPACVREVIALLCEMNLLDDRRFASLWLESRISRRATSPRRLIAGLCARGIDRDDAESALSKTLDADGELELLRRYAEKHAGKTAGKAADDKRALSYKLKSEGFSYQAIHSFFEDSI